MWCESFAFKWGGISLPNKQLTIDVCDEVVRAAFIFLIPDLLGELTSPFDCSRVGRLLVPFWPLILCANCDFSNLFLGIKSYERRRVPLIQPSTLQFSEVLLFYIWGSSPYSQFVSLTEGARACRIRVYRYHFSGSSHTRIWLPLENPVRVIVDMLVRSKLVFLNSQY